MFLRFNRALLLLLCGALFFLAGPLSHAVHAQATIPTLTVDRRAEERVAILGFWAFDQQGNVLPRASEADLAKLASLVPRAVAARIVQSGAYEVLDDPLLELYDATPVGGPRELDRVQELLLRGDVDQVIVGNVAQVQQAIVVSSRRYVMGADGPRVAGASVVRANNASEAVNSVDNLLTQMFPPDSDVVPRPIARIVAVPNVLRIPIGATVPVQAYAIDDLGRPLSAVTLLFQTNADGTALVDAQGNVTGVRPGQAQISLQPLGRTLAPNVQPPRIDVTVTGPSMGLRAGAGMLTGEDSAPRIGLRITPAHEIKTTTPTQQIPQAGTNPTNVLTNLFGALLGNQMLTIDLDVVPRQDISMALNAVQRTARSYFGTGVGVAVPLEDDGASGVLLRLTLGTQLPFRFKSGMSLPIEFTADFILGGAQGGAQARIGASIGIDLFQ